MHYHAHHDPHIGCNQNAAALQQQVTALSGQVKALQAQLAALTSETAATTARQIAEVSSARAEAARTSMANDRHVAVFFSNRDADDESSTADAVFLLRDGSSLRVHRALLGAWSLPLQTLEWQVRNVTLGRDSAGSSIRTVKEGASTRLYVTLETEEPEIVRAVVDLMYTGMARVVYSCSAPCITRTRSPQRSTSNPCVCLCPLVPHVHRHDRADAGQRGCRVFFRPTV